MTGSCCTGPFRPILENLAMRSLFDVPSFTPTTNPSLQLYTTFSIAYEFFNDQLYNGALPNCLLLLERSRTAKGFFEAQRFVGRHTAHRLDAISLNPDTFYKRTDDQILSTLVHEMCHLWQFHYGTPAKTVDHNREWADKMEAIGLMPSSTGAPGGKRTGQRVTHYILREGFFIYACQELLATGLSIGWQAQPVVQFLRS